MWENDCGILPVVAKGGKVVGLITDRDICLSLALEHNTPFIKTTVGQIMLSKVHTVKTTDDISVAYRQMRTNQISRLPVVDGQGKLKGIVSLHNLIQQLFSNGQDGFGNLYAEGENLSKTIKAITRRYNGSRATMAQQIELLIKPNIEFENQYEDDLYGEIVDLYEEY